MNFFGCMSDTAVLKQQHSRIEKHEEDLVTKILSEGLKLKNKCKSLSKLLADAETQRQLDREKYLSTIADMEEKHNKALEELKTANIFELAASRETERAEIEMLTKIKGSQEMEIEHLHNQIRALNDAIVELQSTDRSYKEMFRSSRIQDMREIDALRMKLSECEQTQQLMQDAILELTCERNTLVNTIQSHLESADGKQVSESVNHASAYSVPDKITKLSFVGTGHDNATDDPSPATPATPITQAEYDELQTKYAFAQDEIIALNDRLQQVLAAKQQVEYCVHQVLTENNNLKDKIESLTKIKK
jgi:hypothetical protein